MGSDQCGMVEVARRLRSDDVLHVLTDLFVQRGPPDHIRSDNVLCWEGIRMFGVQVSVRQFALAFGWSSILPSGFHC